MVCCFGSEEYSNQTNQSHNSDGHQEQQSWEHPDRNKLRELQAQAAEKRMKESQSKGIKNLDAVKRQQAKSDQMNAKADINTAGGLKWQVG